jgi:hypothetical protein
MKERPILFSTPMVQAILEGRKTQTRRVIKPQPEPLEDGFMLPLHPDCPYGYIGDRLWVRETFAYHHTGRLFYKADIPVVCHKNWKWKPPIFMPRSASRITLEITDIRVERLQDITRSDIYAEGLIVPQEHQEDYKEYLLNAWIELWDSINAKKHPWQSNPYVWVVEFKRIEK